MSQPHNRDVIHSLDLIQQVTRDATGAEAGHCDGDCANCPCSGGAAGSAK